MTYNQKSIRGIFPLSSRFFAMQADRRDPNSVTFTFKKLAISQRNKKEKPF